jgi:hypothetical protein
MDLPPDRVQKIIALLVEWSHDVTRRHFASWQKAIQRANTEAASVGIFASMVQPTATTTPKLAATKLLVTLGNCGKAGNSILAGLAAHVPDLSTALKRPAEQPVRLSFGRSLLAATLKDVPRTGDVRLLDCSFTSLHTFLIEVHSDGRRFLYQGYQGGYSGTWWQGTEESGLERQNLSNLDIELLTKARDRYGCGRRIADKNYEAFVVSLGAALTADDWTAFTAIWGNLPFCPTSGEMDNMRARGTTALPVLEITSYTVTLPTEPPLLVNQDGSVGAAFIPAQVG